MDFYQAEDRFRELQKQIQRGGSLTQQEYEEELQKLMVQDQDGTFWCPDPETGRWLYFNGTDWAPGTPPHEARVAPQGRTAPPIEAPEGTAPPGEGGSEPVPTAGSLPMTESFAPPGEPESWVPPTATMTGAASASQPPAGSPGMPSTEPENVPTYARSAEPIPTGPMRGLLPRPVRGSTYPSMDGERSWLPFAIMAVILALCALVIFFGVRPLFLGGTGPAAQATETASATEVVVVPRVTSTLPVPTSTRAPTNTPPAGTIAPTKPALPTGKVNADPLNVRAGPGSTYAVVGTLSQGTTVTITGRSQDGKYLQIQYPDANNTAWVASQYIDLTGGDITSLPVVAAPTPAAPARPTNTAPRPTNTAPRPAASATPIG